MAENDPIWDENNVLVDKELADHFAEQSEMVLGQRPVPGKKVDEIGNASINAPYLTQQLESQTKDVMTSPEPTSDPNTRPTKLQTMTEQQAELDRAIIDGAKHITEAQAEARLEEAPPATKSTSPKPAKPAPEEPVAPLNPSHVSPTEG